MTQDLDLSFRPSWRPHALLGLLAIGLCGIWLVQRRTDQQLLDLVEDPKAAVLERCSAVHKLASRPSVDDARIQYLREHALHSSEYPLQLVATSAELQGEKLASRIGPPPKPLVSMERECAARYPLDAESFLWFVAYRRKVGGMLVGARRRIDLREAEWTLDALAGKSIPTETVEKHILDRLLAARRSR